MAIAPHASRASLSRRSLRFAVAKANPDLTIGSDPVKTVPHGQGVALANHAACMWKLTKISTGEAGLMVPSHPCMARTEAEPLILLRSARTQVQRRQALRQEDPYHHVQG